MSTYASILDGSPYNNTFIYRWILLNFVKNFTCMFIRNIDIQFYFLVIFCKFLVVEI